MNNNNLPDKKRNRNRKFPYLSNPKDIIEAIENSRFKNKEGLFKVLGFFLYRVAYGYSMRVSQKTIASYLGLDRGHVNELIMKLRELGLIVMTYHTKTRNGIVCNEVSSYKISQALRDPSPEFQSKMCYLFPFLAKVSIAFFCYLGALTRRFSKHLKYINPTLYINRSIFINSFYNDAHKRSQKESRNGVENPTRGKDASSISSLFANLGFAPKKSTP